MKREEEKKRREKALESTEPRGKKRIRNKNGSFFRFSFLFFSFSPPLADAAAAAEALLLSSSSLLSLRKAATSSLPFPLLCRVSFFSLSLFRSSLVLALVSGPSNTETILPPAAAKTIFQATVVGIAHPSPVTVTAGNKSFPWQLHGWMPPNKNTTLGALGRSVGSVANSSSPLNATKAVAKGLELYKKETEALILGQAGIVSFVNSVNTSAFSGSSIKCFVDPSTGQLVGLQQGSQTACSTTGGVTVVPASAGYISQVKLAYTYDGAFIGRLVFELKTSATAKPVSYSCGSAGGKAVDLLPSKKGNYVVTKLGVGCAPLPLSAVAAGTGLSARNVSVAAAALASLPIDPATGVPQTPPLGDVLGGGGAPTPAPSAPTVTFSSAILSSTATTLVIYGVNFDPTAAGNVVTLSSGTVATIVSATATSLTIVFATQPNLGPLTATVTSFGLSSGAAVQVADVQPMWRVVGTAGFSAGIADYTSLAFDSTGTPYVAYEDGSNGNKATVQKFSAGSWTVVGTAGFSAGQASYVSLALDSTGTPFVAYVDGSNGFGATVQTFVAGSGWTLVGTAGFSAGIATFTSLAIDSTTGNPFVAYRDDANGNKVTVQTFVMGSWSVVGTAGFSAGAASYTSLVLDSTGTPFVAYRDNSIGNKATVQTFVMGSWSVVGTAGFSAGSAPYLSLALDSTGTPFVAYADGANSLKAIVQTFSAGSWTVVGTAGFSAGSALYTSLALDSTGTPYVAYKDGANGDATTVQKLMAGSWTVVGPAGFSAGSADYTSIAIDPTTGTPFVAFKDGSNGGAATVEKYD